ncbi:MAG: DUF255 domain-containing protein [Thiogranum sp.]|nr:DUF255 domain-containing protein [Thiogranum sp.]
MVGHPSPYLAMHAQDPVRWQTWSAGTLELARRLNRPLLISVGYFSCHWCHVMQRESFQDQELAEHINSAFVPVKIDRELQPALDDYLMDFVRVTRGQAGWPLTVFLTPDGYPLLGVTYQPRDDFAALLNDLHQRWLKDGESLQVLARDALREWEVLREAAQKSGSDAKDFTRDFLRQVEQRQDEMSGGFGQQSKFPMAAQLQALLWLRAQHDDTRFDDFIRLTLDSMADGGLHDLLGGGFFRYVTDPLWQTPHYEKMLYDNAWLALLYMQAADQLQSARYRRIGLSTVDFLMREMRTPGGWFISSFSAVDDQGREGCYYLWNQGELQEQLNPEQLKAVTAAWFDPQDPGADCGKLPRLQRPLVDVAEQLKWQPEKLHRVLESARSRLLDARGRRGLPADRKGIAAWNGLTLSALAAAHTSSGDQAYAVAASALVDHVMRHWWDGTRLVRATRGEKVVAAATPDDYALVARGLWDWKQIEPASVDEKAIAQMVRRAWRLFYRKDRWVLDQEPLIPMLGGRIAVEDGSLPSASAVIAELSVQVQSTRVDAALKSNVTAHLEHVQSRLGNAAFWYAGYLKLLAGDQPLR